MTRTNFKKLLKEKNLFINVKSSFDGMVDGCEPQYKGFQPVKTTDLHIENTLGIEGLWLVNGGRDYFRAYEDEKLQGIEITNCCGRSIIAKEK
jgi:hypothetical protein